MESFRRYGSIATRNPTKCARFVGGISERRNDEG